MSTDASYQRYTINDIIISSSTNERPR